MGNMGIMGAMFLALPRENIRQVAKQQHRLPFTVYHLQFFLTFDHIT
jgi:hypothetical protein